MTIDKLIKQKRALKMDGLEITNFGVKEGTTDYGSVNIYDSLELGFYGNTLDHFVRHFAVDYLPWGISFYCSVSQLGRLRELYCTKLNIETLKIAGKVWEEPHTHQLLIEHLVEMGGVRCLNVLCQLPQEFYDQLATVPYIAHLIISRTQLSLSCVYFVDFEFIRNIRFLNDLDLSIGRFALDSFFDAFKKSKIRRLSVRIECPTSRKGVQLDLKMNRIVLWLRRPIRTVEFNSLDDAVDAFKEGKFDFLF